MNPRARGGRHAGNVLLACKPCNTEKADKLPTTEQLTHCMKVWQNVRLWLTLPEEKRP